MTNLPAPTTIKNRLLAALPATEYDRLRPHLTAIELTQKQVLHYPETPIDRVYFPESAVLSSVFTTEDGTPLEVGTIGNYGLAGVSVALGTDRTPNATEVLVGGMAQRMSTDALRAEVARGATIARLLRRYAQAATVHAGQMQVCLRLHSPAERLAGWLLLVSGANSRERLPLTHAEIGMMLGVPRSSVTMIARQLQTAKLINYSRGHITILDRRATAGYACKCVSVIHDEYERVFTS